MLDLTGAPMPWPAGLTSVFSGALARAADDEPLRDVAWEGDMHLRELLAGRFRAPIDQVVVTSGVRACVRGLTSGRTTVIERPTFAGIPRMLSMLGHPFRFATWPEMLSGRPGASGTDQTWWVTSPARNPDGLTLTPDEAGTLAERAASAGARVVQNVSYLWFDPAAALVPGAILIGGLHKLAGPGARLGWAIGAGTADLLRPELRAAAPSGLWQRAWSAMLDGGGVQPLLDGIGRVVGARDAFLRAVSPLAEPPPPAPHLLLAVAGSDAAGLQLMERAGISGGAGAAFHAPAPGVRLSFTTASPQAARMAGARLGGLTGV